MPIDASAFKEESLVLAVRKQMTVSFLFLGLFVLCQLSVMNCRHVLTALSQLFYPTN